MWSVCICIGHGQSVTCASWSHSGRLLITSSDDKTASIWSHPGGPLHPILTFTTAVHNVTADATDKASNCTLLHTACIQHDSIRDAILTCARKPTRVSLIYRMETTTKKCKTEKLKVKTDMLRSNSKSLGKICSQS